MKVSDYIVQFLIEKGITDVWGYPGGSITHFTDSLGKRKNEITAHVVYHEQAAGFAACAYAGKNGIPGVAYSIGGPGATNLITAVAHAYYDSVPVLFLTGNVNTHEAAAHSKYEIRQMGFQDADIVPVAAPITKGSFYVESAKKIRYYLEKAFFLATDKRPGPVLLDLPMDVLRQDVDIDELEGFAAPVLNKEETNDFSLCVKNALSKAERPCLLLGNALKKKQLTEKVRKLVNEFKIPYVTSMIAFDVIEHNEYYCGFAGAYGVRSANIVLSKCDLVISIGSRLDQRQVGAVRANFAKDAKIIRVDIDEGELGYKVHEDEESFCMDVSDALDELLMLSTKDYSDWIAKCNIIKDKLKDIDKAYPTDCIKRISEFIPGNAVITTDVGQNMVWVPQAFEVKRGQRFLFSGGLGSMGHSLPAAIGSCFPKTDKNIAVCFCGDGGLQMNIQELQSVFREQLPVKIIVMNNYALGMIRYFQEQYFDNNYFQTTSQGGYAVPQFANIAQAYGIRGRVVESIDELELLKDELSDDKPLLIEVRIKGDTYVLPKLEYGKPNYDQAPLLDRDLLQELMEL